MSTETVTRTSIVTLLGKCYACGTKSRIDAEIETTDSAWLNAPHTEYRMVTKGIKRDRITGCYSARCECGVDFQVKPLSRGWNRTTKCGARCTSAIGPSCDCQCGGKNHGISHKR